MKKRLAASLASISPSMFIGACDEETQQQYDTMQAEDPLADLDEEEKQVAQRQQERVQEAKREAKQKAKEEQGK